MNQKLNEDQIILYKNLVIWDIIFNKYKPDGVFNLAAETHVDRSIDAPKNFIKSNFLGVYNLLEAIFFIFDVLL